MNLKCLLYARYSTSSLIYMVNKESGNSALSADAEKMASKIKSLKSKSGQRDKLRTAYGVWYVTHDDNDISYGVCTTETYPERHAYGLIAKLQAKIQQINHCEYQTEQNIKSYTKKTANDLASEFNELAKIDKLYKASEQVKELQGQLGEGIKKLMTNQDSLNEMGDKAQKMKGFANQFAVNSEKLERMMYWRNCKIKIIVGLCIVGVLGFVILIIVQRTKSS